VWLWSGVVTDLLGVHPKPLNSLPPGCSVPGWDVLRWYTPMFLWPLLLLAVSWHYLVAAPEILGRLGLLPA
jgi:hypothetical protein